MIGYAQLRPGCGFDVRRAVPYYVQRFVTARGLRSAVSQCLAAAIRHRHGSGLDGPPGAVTEPGLAELKRDGLAMLETLIPPAGLADMLAYFLGQRVAGPNGQSVPPEEVAPGTPMASYPLSTVVACPGLMEAINAPGILRLAAGYLGCKPTISSLGVRWSFPAAIRREQTQLFHRDPDDWRFLKLFVYLTDVGPEAGPHLYVAGSHRSAASLRARPYQREPLERDYGPGSIRTVTGPAGTTFVADTHGIHMGLPPLSAPRLILQVQYSLLPIFAFRYEPVVAAMSRSLDPYVNRLMLASDALAGGASRFLEDEAVRQT